MAPPWSLAQLDFDGLDEGLAGTGPAPPPVPAVIVLPDQAEGQ
ncbi:hypothetical protein [Nocardia higoensis]|nr:hypothetical protein [Nocardia higoensis]